MAPPDIRRHRRAATRHPNPEKRYPAQPRCPRLPVFGHPRGRQNHHGPPAGQSPQLRARAPTVQPCNTCQSCQEITQGSYLDIIEIDGASNRGIDEIRDLREQLRYLPSGGRYKIYIIDEVHMLTKEAFNALLKTLEEPPPHVVFVFATTELEKIPLTIVSRCQRFEFKRVSLAGICEQLAAITHNEGITISPTSLAHIARAAEGSMRDGQSLLDQVIAFCGTEIQDDDVRQLLGHVGSESLVVCLDALFRQDAETALRTVGQLQMEGYEAGSIMKALLEALRHLIVLKTVPQPEGLIPLAEPDMMALRRIADAVSPEEIYGQFHTLSAAEGSLRYASNPMLILEMALVRMACNWPGAAAAIGVGLPATTGR